MMKSMSLLAALLASLISHAYAAGGDRITITNLYRRVNQLSLDINQVGHTIAENASLQVQAGDMTGSPATRMNLSCLLRLTVTTGELSEQLHVLMISTSFGDTAVNAIDRRSAIETSKLTIDQAEEMVPLMRTSISHIMGDCPQSPAVAAKAQELISLISETESVMAALTAKYGHSQYSGAK